jgi:hypothetical protein
MKNIRTFHAVSIGESHIRKNTPCQDAAISYEDHENQIYIGAVSDGHGSNYYFRSDKGSQLLVEITLRNITEFLSQSEDANFFQSSFVSRNTITSGESPVSKDQNTGQNIKASNDALNQLFKSIIASWQQAIQKDWSEATPSKEDIQSLGVSESMIEGYLNGENLQIAYGCTLIAFARTKKYWLAFQIGDGKSIGFNQDMKAIEPIPTDELCQGSVTTSMCEENAFDNFRYAYGTDIPSILIIGSDGLDGYFSKVEENAIEPLKGLYRSVVESFLTKGFDDGLNELNNSLPVLSQRGVTQDDMSVVGWIDFSKKEELLKGITHFKKLAAEQKLKEAEGKLVQEQQELKEYEVNLSAKSNEIAVLEEQLSELKSVYEQSQSTILALKENIASEEEKQKEIKKQRDEKLTQKQKLEGEFINIERVKQNKIQNIQKVEVEKQKNKSLIESFESWLNKFFKN